MARPIRPGDEEWMRRLAARIQADTPRIQAAQPIAKALVQREQLMADTTGANLAALDELDKAFGIFETGIEQMAKRVGARIEGMNTKAGNLERSAIAHVEATEAKLAEYAKRFEPLERRVNDPNARLNGSAQRSPDSDSTDVQPT